MSCRTGSASTRPPIRARSRPSRASSSGRSWLRSESVVVLMIWNPRGGDDARPRRDARAPARAAARGAWRGRARACRSIATRSPRPASPRRVAWRSSDLGALPFTVKDAPARALSRSGLFAVPREPLIARIHASSGTKGKPTVVGYTRRDLEVWREVMARALAAGGRRARPPHPDRLRLRPLHRRPGLPRRRRAHGLTVVPVSSGNTLRQILLLQDFRPQGARLHAVVRAPHRREPARAGERPARARRSATASSAPSRGPRRCGRSSRPSGAARPWTSTACRELIGPGVAGECLEARDGLHVNEDHFLPEVVDPADRRAAGPPARRASWSSPGSPRKPCRCSATAPATSRASTPTPCRCGRTTVRMARVKGRTDDMLVIRGVNVYPSQVEAALLTVGELAPHYQLVVDRTQRLPERSRCTWSPPSASVRGLGRLRRARAPRSAGSPRGWRSACAATWGSIPRSRSCRPRPFPAARARRCGSWKGDDHERRTDGAAAGPHRRRASGSSRPTR